MQKPSNLLKILVTTFIISMVLSVAVLKIFGFEIGIIFAICLSVSILATVSVGLENIIINKNSN